MVIETSPGQLINNINNPKNSQTRRFDLKLIKAFNNSIRTAD